MYMMAALLLFTACSGKYEEHYDSLKVSHRVINLSNDEPTEIQVIVYYSGKWEGYVQEDCDWLKLKNPSGEGVTIVHVEVAAKNGTDRTGTLHFRAGDDEQIINIRQK